MSSCKDSKLTRNIKMHRIYLEKRCIIICPPYEQALTDPNAIQFSPGERISIHTLTDMFEHSEALSRIYIPADDTEATYRSVCSEFREVNAGGGVVSNRRGDVLLIRRNGLWDLPKGHQEEGEDIRTTAIREVEEETGIKSLELQDLICITDHCYLRNGIWHLKHTWWFNMLNTAPLDLTPQTEEDISKAAWVARSVLPSYLTNTYPSIAEVFREDRIYK